MDGGGFAALGHVYRDTHVAVWLHDGLVDTLTAAAKEAIDLLIPPMVYLEFAYLHRRGRVRFFPSELFTNLSTSFGVNLCSQGYPGVATAATELEWTNNPFDCIIMAQSQCDTNWRLVTADRLILTNYDRAAGNGHLAPASWTVRSWWNCTN